MHHIALHYIITLHYEERSSSAARRAQHHIFDRSMTSGVGGFDADILARRRVVLRV